MKLQTRRARRRKDMAKRLAIGIFVLLFFVGAVGISLIVSVAMSQGNKP